jgi:hypothetical protein
LQPRFPRTQLARLRVFDTAAQAVAPLRRGMAFAVGGDGALGGLPQRRLQQIGGLTFDSPITTFLIVIGVICFSAPAIWWCGAFCAAPACQLPRCRCTLHAAAASVRVRAAGMDVRVGRVRCCTDAARACDRALTLFCVMRARAGRAACPAPHACRR